MSCLALEGVSGEGGGGEGAEENVGKDKADKGATIAASLSRHMSFCSYRVFYLFVFSWR